MQRDKYKVPQHWNIQFGPFTLARLAYFSHFRCLLLHNARDGMVAVHGSGTCLGSHRELGDTHAVRELTLLRSL